MKYQKLQNFSLDVEDFVFDCFLDRDVGQPKEGLKITDKKRHSQIMLKRAKLLSVTQVSQ